MTPHSARPYLFGTRVLVLACAVLAASAVARAQAVDPNFNPGANGVVQTMVMQADGKILVGGFFTTLGGGGTGTTTRNSIGRLLADGSLDTAFDPGAGDSGNINLGVYALAVQADGKILVGGDFMTLGGGGYGTTARSRIGRLNVDGSIDPTFNPGASDTVRALAVQPDGKILVGGDFTTLGGGGTGTTARYFIGRLNADGSLDASFNPGASQPVNAVVVQADLRILVGGYFTTLGNGGTGDTIRLRIGRLNADGSLDVSFDPGTNGPVYAVAVQADGRILVGGWFTALGGGGKTPLSMIGRLNTNGSLDTSFNPGANSYVYALAVQADGKILIGGYFTTLGGGGSGTTARNYIGRLNADGSLDTSFDPGASNFLTALAVQADGKILVGGNFMRLGGGGTGTTTRRQIGRLWSSPATPTIAWPPPPAIVYGTALSVTQLTATASFGGAAVGGTFAFTPVAGTVLTVGTHTLSTTFTPADTATYTSATKTVTIDVTNSAGVPTFSDDPLTAGTTTAKGLHITELRQAIDALRTRSGLGAFAWTDATLTARVTPIKAVHLTELRSALNEVYAMVGATAPTYTHATVTGRTTVITAVDIAELRAAVLAIW